MTYLGGNWKWAAAVCTKFEGDGNGLGVKPVEGSRLSIYKNAHHSGTPESYTRYVVGGARGGGGSNFTGSYSGTKFVDP